MTLMRRGINLKKKWKEPAVCKGSQLDQEGMDGCSGFSEARPQVSL